MARKSVIKFHTISSFFANEHKLLERGENAYNSGHVSYGMWDKDLEFIQGKVHASMKDKEYLVKIFIDDAGKIKESTCTCPRGQVRCHHMAAVLLYTLYNVSITDVACSWSAKKPLEIDEVKTINELFPSGKEYNATAPLSEEKKEKFYQSLKKKATMVGFSWLLSPEPQCSAEKTLEDFLFSKEFSICKNKGEALLSYSSLTTNIIIEINKKTIGQSTNPLWLIERKHRITSSNFGIILKACLKGKYSPSLFKTLCGSYSLGGVKSINWGHENEIHAVSKFEEVTSLKVLPCGIVLHNSGLLGASPDGYIEEEDSLLEVKCPYKYRDVDLSEVFKMDQTYFIQYNAETGLFFPNKKHNYYHQIQGQLHIAQKNMCNFVAWTPHSCIIIEVFKDENWSPNLNILIDFYIHKYVPYLLNKI